MVVNNKFHTGEIVFLKTDPDQMSRIVTAILVCGDNSILYELTCGVQTSRHYDFEINSEKLYTNA